MKAIRAASVASLAAFLSCAPCLAEAVWKVSISASASNIGLAMGVSGWVWAACSHP